MKLKFKVKLNFKVQVKTGINTCMSQFSTNPNVNHVLFAWQFMFIVYINIHSQLKNATIILKSLEYINKQRSNVTFAVRIWPGHRMLQSSDWEQLCRDQWSRKPETEQHSEASNSLSALQQHQAVLISAPVVWAC